MRRRLLLLIFMLFGAAGTRADVVVVASAKASIERLSADDVINIFLGRYRRLSGGGVAVPVDQPAASALRAEFYRRLANKDLAEINAYWARLHFSGKTSPPLQAETTAEVVAHVLNTPGGIGYVERGEVDARLKIVMEFPALDQGAAGKSR